MQGMLSRICPLWSITLLSVSSGTATGLSAILAKAAGLCQNVVVRLLQHAENGATMDLVPDQAGQSRALLDGSRKVRAPQSTMLGNAQAG